MRAAKRKLDDPPTTTCVLLSEHSDICDDVIEHILASLLPCVSQASTHRYVALQRRERILDRTNHDDTMFRKELDKSRHTFSIYLDRKSDSTYHMYVYNAAAVLLSELESAFAAIASYVVRIKVNLMSLSGEQQPCVEVVWTPDPMVRMQTHESLITTQINTIHFKRFSEKIESKHEPEASSAVQTLASKVQWLEQKGISARSWVSDTTLNTLNSGQLPGDGINPRDGQVMNHLLVLVRSLLGTSSSESISVTSENEDPDGLTFYTLCISGYDSVDLFALRFIASCYQAGTQVTEVWVDMITRRLCIEWQTVLCAPRGAFIPVGIEKATKNGLWKPIVPTHPPDKSSMLMLRDGKPIPDLDEEDDEDEDEGVKDIQTELKNELSTKVESNKNNSIPVFSHDPPHIGTQLLLSTRQKIPRVSGPTGPPSFAIFNGQQKKR